MTAGRCDRNQGGEQRRRRPAKRTCAAPIDTRGRGSGRVRHRHAAASIKHRAWIAQPFRGVKFVVGLLAADQAVFSAQLMATRMAGSMSVSVGTPRSWADWSAGAVQLPFASFLPSPPAVSTWKDVCASAGLQRPPMRTARSKSRTLSCTSARPRPGSRSVPPTRKSTLVASSRVGAAQHAITTAAALNSASIE